MDNRQRGLTTILLDYQPLQVLHIFAKVVHMRRRLASLAGRPSSGLVGKEVLHGLSKLTPLLVVAVRIRGSTTCTITIRAVI